MELYKKDPSFFHPSARKGKDRIDFCNSIKWTNEQVEGWFIMFNRNPKKDQILDKYDRPNNRPLLLNQARQSDDDDQDSSSPSQRRPESPVTRGRGRGRGGRGKKRGQRIYRPPNE